METREEYQERAEAKLEELRRKIWMLGQKAEQMRNESEAEYEAPFQALHSRLEQVGASIDELEEANDEIWQELKGRVDGALSDLNNSVGNVLSRVG